MSLQVKRALSLLPLRKHSTLLKEDRTRQNIGVENAVHWHQFERPIYHPDPDGTQPVLLCVSLQLAHFLELARVI